MRLPLRIQIILNIRMNDELTNYKRWNRALWHYFFPAEKEDPILYVDNGVLEQIASDNQIHLPYGMDSWSDFFLKTTLLKEASFESFVNQLRAEPQLSCFNPRPKTWDKLVEHLEKGKLNNCPAYFSMLCSIFYIAAQYGADHAKMLEGAKAYLGESYRSRFGQLVDPLLQKLHEDVPSFNQNRMICGTQRHMSRIKFHLVLPRAEREDFIDFIEINSLKWDRKENSFSFFIDRILVPALTRANKIDMAKKVTRQENIPYFTSILLSDHEYGKPSSKFENTLQKKDIRWRFQLVFDYNDNYHFHVLSDSYLPFGVALNGDHFEQIDVAFQSDYIAENIDLKNYADAEFKHLGDSYVFANIASGQKSYGHCFYFEQTSADTYIQVDTPVDGKNYYAFAKSKLKTEPGWSLIAGYNIGGYYLYEINSFTNQSRSSTSNRICLKDTFRRRNIGSWYSINLEEGQSIFWLPNKVGSQRIPITDCFKNTQGVTYFHIPSDNERFLSGTLLVMKGDKEILSDPISVHFSWMGGRSPYYINGWGELVSGQYQDQVSNHPPLRKTGIQRFDKSSESSPSILLELIHDIADAQGLVKRRKLDAAIGFALSFHDISPTPQVCRSVIYCLRRLGYVLKNEIDHQEESYQLVAPFLEKTNYSLTTISNALLVKGVYSQNQIEDLLSNQSIRTFHRIRPYKKEALADYPEYKCLPDQILIETGDDLPWVTLDNPIADQFLFSMKDIKGFSDHFGIYRRGDVFLGIPPTRMPGMVKGIQGHEVLCTKQNDKYLIHLYYSRDRRNYPIPKHLARLFAQIERNDPICLMGLSNRDIDYSQISFVNNMGVPEVLDMALCDLNLIMPSYETVFILFQESQGIHSGWPWTKRRTYDTHTMNDDHSYMISWLSKLAGKGINNLKDEQKTVLVTGTMRGYRLLLKTDYSHHKALLSLYKESVLLAFGLGKDVFCLDEQSDLFKRVDGTDVNYLLSMIITEQKNCLTLREAFSGNLEAIKNSNGTEIPILKHIKL